MAIAASNKPYSAVRDSHSVKPKTKEISIATAGNFPNVLAVKNHPARIFVMAAAAVISPEGKNGNSRQNSTDQKTLRLVKEPK